MKLLIIFGPPAVGKLTVGQALEVRTDYKLFHNHAVMDGIMHIFGRNTPAEDRLSRIVRENIIKEAAESGTNLIFTYVWNFSQDKGKNNIDAYKQLYESRGGKVLFVELTAPATVRSQRAASPERQQLKSSAPKPDEILQQGDAAKFESPKPFFYPGAYLHIDTTDKTPEDVASQIISWQAHAQ